MDGALPPLLITMGEPAGIGGELTLEAWRHRRERRFPIFAALDDPPRLAALSAALGWNVPIKAIDTPQQAASVFADALPVLPVPLGAPVKPGWPDPANAASVIASIERAVQLCQAGEGAAVVTQPIQKASLYAAGFRHPGHTEFLAELTGADLPVMMLAVEGVLRVVPITIHEPIARVPTILTRDLVMQTARIAADGLRRDFGIAAPRLVLAGLNPHAGEDGTIGREEVDVLKPAVIALRAEGIDITGPYPADSLFHEAARARYDLALCPTHDQALIPLKTLDFWNGVNVTLGLPIARTSPDHGTALDLAGTGRADARSLFAAIAMAGRMAEARHLAKSLKP